MLFALILVIVIIIFAVMAVSICAVVEAIPGACNLVSSLSHRHLTAQWRLGLFMGVCCMVAGFVYGLVWVR